MPEETPEPPTDPEFNTRDIAVLVRDTTGHVFIERLPLMDTPYIDAFLKTLANLPPDQPPPDPLEIFKRVTSDAQLSVLLAPYDYCWDFTGAFRDYRISTPEIRARTVDYPGSPTEKLGYLHVELLHRRLAHKLEDAYKAHDSLRPNGRVILYTHRKRGFEIPVFRVSDDFQIQLKTNFGYGRSSYFYLRLTYKNLPIVPYSHWIEYRLAEAFETIEYWRNYEVENTSWNQALLDCRDAVNLCVSDKAAFIDKYIVKELEALVSGLDALLNETIGYVENHERRVFVDENQGIRLDGTTKRGAKIVGALKFIESINRFQSSLDVSEYVERILACNRTLLLTMHREALAINAELSHVSSEIDKNNTQIAELRETYPISVGIYDCLCPHYVRTWSECLMTKMQAFLPEFSTVVPQYAAIREETDRKGRYVASLRGLLEDVTRFIETAGLYFCPTRPESNVDVAR